MIPPRLCCARIAALLAPMVCASASMAIDSVPFEPAWPLEPYQAAGRSACLGSDAGAYLPDLFWREPGPSWREPGRSWREPGPSWGEPSAIGADPNERLALSWLDDSFPATPIGCCGDPTVWIEPAVKPTPLDPGQLLVGDAF